MQSPLLLSHMMGPPCLLSIMLFSDVLHNSMMFISSLLTTSYHSISSMSAHSLAVTSYHLVVKIFLLKRKLVGSNPATKLFQLLTLSDIFVSFSNAFMFLKWHLLRHMFRLEGEGALLPPPPKKNKIIKQKKKLFTSKHIA